ncbi:MAG: hypothetical protein ACRC67_15650 [Inquilinus sp.]|uniref:hypothetical protein n=1 Tax=Inquilinus sp. TaxID=1932117 RepID=UPI003F2CAF47
MIRQSSTDHTTSAQDNSYPTVELRPAHGLQRDTATLDTPSARARQIRHYDEFDLPLYQASLAANVSAIPKLCPQASLRRATVMAATARAFARITTGWDDGALHRGVRPDLWRLAPGSSVQQARPGPRCAVCGRPAVYRLRDTSFCRMHGPDHLDRRADSLFSDPAVSDRCHTTPAAARDLSINH